MTSSDDLRIILTAILEHLDSDPVELRLACASYIRTRDGWPCSVRGLCRFVQTSVPRGSLLL
jgi:hypothetical protein